MINLTKKHGSKSEELKQFIIGHKDKEYTINNNVTRFEDLAITIIMCYEKLIERDEERKYLPPEIKDLEDKDYFSNPEL